jgi:UDPglucose 6-dehydrogenase
MNIGVLGLWHLGSVTAAGLAALGHRVIGLDFDAPRVAKLSKGVAPVFEPGLDELITRGLSSGNLRFSSKISDATDIDLLWVTYDTPIDAQDGADTNFVMQQIEHALLDLPTDLPVLISSQLPIGSVHRLQQAEISRGNGRQRRFAYGPENLRLGNAVNDFLHPGRVVIGVSSDAHKDILQALFSSITDSIEWMSVESAEMTKHAINAFFAASVVFANEVALICERVGADAKEVERGLKTEPRIGARAYLAPGGAFAGGTLARDIGFLKQVARAHGISTPLLSSVLPSNDAHKCWVQKKIQDLFADLSQLTVAVWGLTYKAGTDTLRGSVSVDLCDWLIRQGATIHVHDPVVQDLPARWSNGLRRFDDPAAALQGADALVLATEWPLYRLVIADEAMRMRPGFVVLDANHYLTGLAGSKGLLKYFAVGMPLKEPSHDA